MPVSGTIKLFIFDVKINKKRDTIMLKNPRVFEINTRVWLRQFDSTRKARLFDVPAEKWDHLRLAGFDAVWLMGIWKTSKDVIEKCCFEPGLVESYSKALPDWKKEDVIGSPYAIDIYEPDPSVCKKGDLLKFKKMLNDKGLSLILDFIPNHFSAASSLLDTNPGIFLQGREEDLINDPYTFFRHGDKIFAHGRDPFFPAWTDTAQVNYYSKEAREYMTGVLLMLTEVCDGVRCDMAMLALNNIFGNTWQGTAAKPDDDFMKQEFWKNAIEKVKNASPGFTMIAETYWNLEYTLQQLGFDFTYDKVLYDRLKSAGAFDIKAHLTADLVYQEKLVRFTENHDEDRAAHAFGIEKSMAAAVAAYTTPGLKLFHNGQPEGKKVKLPVQLGREPNEPLNERLNDFYDKLFKILRHEIFRTGEWELLESSKVWDYNYTNVNVICWQWKSGDEKRLVVVNYSGQNAQCRVQFNPETAEQFLLFNDLLNDKIYVRSVKEIYEQGLYVDLGAYRSHIFSY